MNASQKPYYVYALKDPRTARVEPFYVGKGTGARVFDHLTKPDVSPKGQRISEIREAGHEVVTVILADDLTEQQALKLEAEIISVFGTQVSGGLLLNQVIPKASSIKKGTKTKLPVGAYEKSQIGLALIKEAIVELVKSNPSGITNADAAKTLGLQSDYQGGSKDYLSFSLLGILMNEGRVTRSERRYQFRGR